MTTGAESEPLILIVSGPSGSGKSTLVQKNTGIAGDHAFDLMYYSAASRD